jgi:hypothetical protein
MIRVLFWLLGLNQVSEDTYKKVGHLIYAEGDAAAREQVQRTHIAQYERLGMSGNFVYSIEQSGGEVLAICEDGSRVRNLREDSLGAILEACRGRFPIVTADDTMVDRVESNSLFTFEFPLHGKWDREVIICCEKVNEKMEMNSWNSQTTECHGFKIGGGTQANGYGLQLMHRKSPLKKKWSWLTELEIAELDFLLNQQSKDSPNEQCQQIAGFLSQYLPLAGVLSLSSLAS